MPSKIIYISIFAIYLLAPRSMLSQDPCGNNFISVFGSVIEDERGYSLAASLDNQFIFAGGTKADSAVIIKIRTTGEIEWTRSFDVVPGRDDHLYGLIVDSEGMLAVSGIAGSTQTGGTVFIFRYDPDNNQVLWTKELTSTSLNYTHGLIELGPGGDYVVSNNPTAPNNAELVRLNRNTGNVVNGFSKHYHLGSSESIYDFTFLQGQLFASGRFSDGGGTADMRNTVMRLDPVDGDLVWIKLGHRPTGQAARLYGLDLAAAQDHLFSAYIGDDSGASISNTKLFIQKTTPDGNRVWLKQYELPGTNDWVDEIIASNGGLVIQARNRVAPSDLILFKIDYDGAVLWAKRYDYAVNDNGVFLGSAMSQLIEADGHYFFTGYAEEGGNSDMLFIKTNLEGEIATSCTQVEPLHIQVRDVNNPTFYTKNITVFTYVPTLEDHSLQAGIATSLQTKRICYTETIQQSFVEISLCQGEGYAGYAQTGIFVDTLITADGCDSIRTLDLTVFPVFVSDMALELCFGEQYEGYTQSGIFVDTFSSVSGCDSIRTLNLLVYPEAMGEINKMICIGSVFEGYSQTGTYTDTFVISTGCDSIRILYLEVATELIHENRITICEGEVFEGHSQQGIYMDTLTSVFGCDSIVILQLTIPPTVETFVTGSVCDAGFYPYTQAGLYADTLVSFSGCDSIRTLQLQDVSLYIPNVFSPNGDQINDMFLVYLHQDLEQQMKYFGIYERTGGIVYETTSVPIQWNGRDERGNYFNPAVFTYLLIYTCAGKEIRKTGDITLIR